MKIKETKVNVIALSSLHGL